jgi:hypothetical protein
MGKRKSIQGLPDIKPFRICDWRLVNGDCSLDGLGIHPAGYFPVFDFTFSSFFEFLYSSFYIRVSIFDFPFEISNLRFVIFRLGLGPDFGLISCLTPFIFCNFSGLSR